MPTYPTPRLVQNQRFRTRTPDQEYLTPDQQTLPPEQIRGLPNQSVLQTLAERAQPQDTLDRYYVMRGNICCLNTNPDVKMFYWWLTVIHWVIDKYHDQLAGGRGDSLKSKDQLYRQKGLINNIIKSSVGQNIQFIAGSSLLSKTYGTDNGVHTLQQAFERDGNDFFLEVNGLRYNAPSLPEMHIVPWTNCGGYGGEVVSNKMVVYKRFDTPQGCDNVTAGNVVHNHASINTAMNPNYGYVLDAGPSEVFNAIIKGSSSPNSPLVGNGQSGKLDSSSSSGEVTPLLPNGNIPEQHQSLVPFMNIYTVDGRLFGPVMLYSTILSFDEFTYLTNDLSIRSQMNIEENHPVNGHVVLLAFKLATFNTINNRIDPDEMYSNARNMGGLNTTGTRMANAITVITSPEWVNLIITTSVPELPSIAKYMAGNRGCFSYIKNVILGRKTNLCEQYKNVALQLFAKIRYMMSNQPTIFANDPFYDESSDFVMAFLMAAKCDGDQKRGLDAFVLSNIGGYSFTTGTIDGFLSRFLCLGNLYVYCPNKNGGNLTVNDIRHLSDEQIREIKNKNDESNCNTLLNRFKSYNNVVPVGSTVIDVIASFIPVFKNMIDIIKDGILNPSKLKLVIARTSRRSTFSDLTTSTFYEYSPNNKIFSQEEMESILRYYLVFVQAWIFLNLLSDRYNNYLNDANNNRVALLSDLSTGLLSCNADNRDETIQKLTAFETDYGNLFTLLDKCYSIVHFMRNTKYRDDSNVREVVNDFSKFFRMNICSESLNKLVENPINGITNDIRPIIECEFEPSVTWTITSKSIDLLINYGIVPSFGGTIIRKKINPRVEKHIDFTAFKIFYYGKDYQKCLLIANQIMNYYINQSNNQIYVNDKTTILTEFISICEMLYLFHYIRDIYVQLIPPQPTNIIDDYIGQYELVFDYFDGLIFDTPSSIHSRQDMMVRLYGVQVLDNPFQSIYVIYELIKNISISQDEFQYPPDYYDVPNEIISPYNAGLDYSPYYNDYNYNFEVIEREFPILKNISYEVAPIKKTSTRATKRRQNRRPSTGMRGLDKNRMSISIGGRKKSHRPRNIKKNKTRKIRRKTLKLR
jgi:hypothetical protein